MDEEIMKQCRQAFDDADLNDSGGIDCFELLAALRKHFPSTTLPEIMDVFNRSDLDHNGEIDFDEFITIIKQFNLKCIDRFESDDAISLIFKSLNQFHRDESSIIDRDCDPKTTLVAITEYLEMFDLSIDGIIERIHEKEMSLESLEKDGIDIVTFRKIFFI